MAGHDIRNLKLKWLRSQVSVVLQNPQLFSGTVFDNVAIGLTGTDLAYRLGIDNVAEPSPIIAKRIELIRERVKRRSGSPRLGNLSRTCRWYPHACHWR